MNESDQTSATTRRQTWRRLAAAAGGIALIAALAWAFAPRPVAVEIATAAVGRFEATIDDDGRTRLEQRYLVSAPLAGRLARITLREGDAVAAGAVLATILPLPAPLLDERSTREAGAREAAARAALQRAGVRIERARVGVELAGVELARSAQLARDGFVAPTKLDADRLAAIAAQKELDTAVQERHIAEHELQTAQAALAVLRGSGGSRALDVRAPVAGTVLRVLQVSEGAVAPGTPLIELGDLARLEVVAELLSSDALRTPPGTAVHIDRWGGSGTLRGRVERVEPAAFTKVSALGVEEQRVKVIITITSPREAWRALGDGYRVGVRCVVEQSDAALQVPASAVFPLPDDGPGAASGANGARRMAAFVVDGGRARLTPVTLRARNGSMAWIVDGLAAGARVIVYPPAAVRDGVRIAERRV